MARRAMSISKERKFKLESQLEILGKLIKVENFKTKEVQRKYLDKVLRLEIALEEVTLMVEAEGKKGGVKEVSLKDEESKEKGKKVPEWVESLDQDHPIIGGKEKGAKDDGSTGHGNLGEDGKPLEDVD